MADSVVKDVSFVHVNTKAGDCIVFSGWLLHRSCPNNSRSTVCLAAECVALSLCWSLCSCCSPCLRVFPSLYVCVRLCRT
jgi:hypothetical protein